MTKHINTTFLFDILRSLVIVVILSLILSLLEGALIHYLPIGDSVIEIMNIVFLAVSLLLGLILGIRQKEKGLLKGLIVGVTYMLLVFIVYCSMNHSFSVSLSKIIDMITGVIFAMIGGIISVNIKTK